MYIFQFASFASVKRSPFEATSTEFLNGMDCRFHGQLYRYTLDVYIVCFLIKEPRPVDLGLQI
jgi:hypothetical protein